MSTFYSHPSPSKATTSTKRPYESTTPSNLGTPRDSTNGGRSPGPNKKSRSNEEGKDIGKGGQWMIAKLDELQRMYKEVLLAATAVIQYQTYALRLWVPLSIIWMETDMVEVRNHVRYRYIYNDGSRLHGGILKLRAGMSRLIW